LSGHLTVKIGWKIDGMVWRAKKSSAEREFFSGTSIKTIFYNGIEVKDSDLFVAQAAARHRIA